MTALIWFQAVNVSLYLQCNCRKIQQINKVCAEFLFLLSKKKNKRVGKKRKQVRKALTTPLRLKYKRKEDQFGWQMFTFCSIIQPKRCNSEMCCRKCTGKSSRGNQKKTATASLRLRWILICAGLWQQDSLQFVPNMSLCCRQMTSIKTWRRGMKWPTEARVSLTGDKVYFLGGKMSAKVWRHCCVHLENRKVNPLTYKFSWNRQISSNRTQFTRLLI